MGSLSEWLKIMLDEIARKQDDAVRAATEEKQRQLAGATQDTSARKTT